MKIESDPLRSAESSQEQMSAVEALIVGLAYGAHYGRTRALTDRECDQILAEFNRLSVLASASASPHPHGEGWLPIETAPKDRLILGALIRDGKVWRVHDMKHNGLAFYTVAGGSLPQMTHWMPLPPPPSALSASLDEEKP